MRTFLLMVCILGAGFSPPVIAKEGQCDLLKVLGNNDSESHCRCGRSIADLGIDSPPGMSLSAACDYRKTDQHDVLGGFYFKGAATVSGTVRREDSMIFGDYLSFESDKKYSEDKYLLRGVLGRMRFRDNANAFRSFKTPRISAKSACWSAHVTMTVTVLYVLKDYGTDNGGSYAEDYKVLDVGKYVPCTPRD